MAINCAAIPSELLESELFGHEKGAFTGAVERKRGKLEQAGNGTLFLDEIGDMPLKLQSKLLRVLQERQFERIGGQELLTTNMRVIAATHRDLEQLMQQEQFRTDLYYRLNVFPLSIPPCESVSKTCLCWWNISSREEPGKWQSAANLFPPKRWKP